MCAKSSGQSGHNSNGIHFIVFDDISDFCAYLLISQSLLKPP